MPLWSATVPRRAPEGVCRLELFVTRTETHRGTGASSLRATGRLWASALAAALFVLATLPAARAAGQAVQPAPGLEFADFDAGQFVEARRSGSPLVLFFEADWCGPCRKMHEQTFRSPVVLEAAAGYRLFRVDMSEPDSHVERVTKSFRVIGAPTVILFSANGQESTRRFGFISPEDFATMLGEGRKPPQRA